ncbi:MAG TPA: heme lyase CcmF/NrfE family subunit [Acidimicrobiia bacterium]|nr:heme lyase CcmF/NrfE family subunit [Acidimicrobiia bacterium]
MRAALGTLAVAVGLNASLLGVVILARGLLRNDRRLLVAGRRFVWVLLGAAVVAVGAMEWALISHDFSLRYVAENHARATPVLFTISALWGALEGSILLWGLVLAGYLAFVIRKFRDRADDPLVAWATLTGLVVAAFFFGMMIGPANPFRVIEGFTPTDGSGPNPLLQNHPLMAFHPPMLYLGYVGFTVPFMFAVAALVTGRLGEGWLVATRRATLVAWGFLTLGIMLGGWWSYEVLGWGGYWAWDPVENASFLPWLTATAYLHSVMVQERRGMLRVWNLSLLIATFSLTILGTFLTRSGVVNSVHSFTQSAIGPMLLGFLGVVVVTGVGLIGWRGDRLRAPGRIDSPISREGAFLANNLLFAGFAFVVLLGTVFPLVAEALNGTQLSVGEPYFDRMTLPIGITLLFLMAVAPALPWRAASTGVLRARLAGPGWFAAATMLALALLGARGVAQMLAFGLAAFAVAGIVRQVWIAVHARMRADGCGPLRSLVRVVGGNRRLYGGLVVHLGVVMVAVALAASQGYAVKREFTLAKGESASVRDYTITYLGREVSVTGQKRTVAARVAVEKSGRHLGVYAPAVQIFPNATQAIGTPSVRTGLTEDLYLTLVNAPVASDAETEDVTIGVGVNPMILWLWMGGGLLGLGTVVAAWPSRRRREDEPRVPSVGDAGPEPEPVLEGALR